MGALSKFVCQKALLLESPLGLDWRLVAAMAEEAPAAPAASSADEGGSSGASGLASASSESGAESVGVYARLKPVGPDDVRGDVVVHQFELGTQFGTRCHGTFAEGPS